MAVSALVHVMLNAKFVKNAICKKSTFATAMFVLAGAALIFGLGFFRKRRSLKIPQKRYKQTARLNKIVARTAKIGK